MTERQIDRIREAEKAFRELVKVAAQLREEVDKLSVHDVETRAELQKAAERFETQAQSVRDSLRRWREDIH